MYFVCYVFKIVLNNYFTIRINNWIDEEVLDKEPIVVSGFYYQITA
jgi:hypothetical protein